MRSLYACVLSLVTLDTGFGQNYTISTIAGGALRPPVTANSSIGSPNGVAVDAAGNVYFFSLYCIFKIDPNSTITRIAGNFSAGNSGDGGPATEAQLNTSGLGVGERTRDLGLAADNAGDVYIADPFGSGLIRKISTDGVIRTIATGTAPNHIAVDSAGTVYVTNGYQLRKVLPDGTTALVAGSGKPGALGDGGPATDAYLSSATGVAVDSAGNLYIAEPNSHRVRKVSKAGIITTFAGNATDGFSGDGGPATAAQLSAPNDLAVDGAGNVYIGDVGNNRIRKVTPPGIITTIAGDGGWGYSGDGGPAASAHLAPEGIAADTAGNVYVADWGSNRVRKIGTAGTITTLAGDGTLSYAGDGGQAIDARLSMPGTVLPDHQGNLYIADVGNNRVRKVASDGTITTVAGNGNPGYAGDGGPAAAAEVMPRAGLAMDAAGNLYIDEGTLIRKVTPGGIISTVAGSPNTGPLPSPLAPFSNTFGMDSNGNFYFWNGQIQRLAPDGAVTNLTSERIAPTSLVVDASDNVYFANSNSDTIIRISPAGVQSFLSFAPGAGCQSSSLMGMPIGIAFDRAGNLFRAHYSSSTISRTTPAGAVTTIAGNGQRGYSGDGGPATSARLVDPSFLAVDDAGNIYIPDLVDNVVRVLKPAPPAPVSIAAVTNAAGYQTGPVAPGEIVTIFGAGLGGSAMAQCRYGAAGLIDTGLNDTQVSFNGTPARIIYTSANQVAAIVPYSTATGTAQVVVSYQGRASAPVSVPVAASAIALFTADGSGKGQAAAINQGGSTNGQVPAIPGEFISLYATGDGQTSPAGVDGQVAASPLPHPILPVTVTIGGQNAEVQYAGGAPGYFAGLVQINARIPAGLRANGAVPVTVRVGTAVSQAGVTIAVGGN